VGTPEDYLAAHRETRAGAHAGRPEGAFYDPASERRARRLAARAGATVWGFVNAEGGARLGRGARLEDVVLLAGAGVAAHADVRRAIVAGGAVARGTARRAVGPAGPALTPAEHAALRGLGWRVESVTIEALSPRGSGRSFWRLAGPHRRAMLVRYGADRTENARYTGHARFLRRLGLPVPRVLAEHTEKRFAILEDLGDRTLAEAVRGTTATTFLRRYAEVVDLVARWHGERVASAARREKLALEPPFGPSVYRYERELFLHDFLAERLSVSDAELRNVDRDLRSVAHCLTAAPPVLLHRDLQSSNILLRRGRAHFIDFQGMRFGPAMYDVASLLCDPYVEFPAGVPERLLARYLRRREGSAGEADFFWPAAVERLAQALGAFARLAALPGGGHFAEFIPLAVKRLRDAVERCDLPLPALRVLMATIEKRTPRRIGRRDRGFRSPSMPPAFSRREA
jgi:hypothetical protein